MPLTTPSKLELKNLRNFADFTDKKVVEIGSGDGRLTWSLASVAAQWINLDPDLAETRAAASTLHKWCAPKVAPPPNVLLFQGDGRALSLPSNYFDIAFFSWSLCWIPHTEMALAVAEAYRVLKPGGLLLDVHPIDEPAALEIWYTQYATGLAEIPANLDVRYFVIGSLNYAPTALRDFTATTETLIETLNDVSHFQSDHSAIFEYQYFFDSLDEFTAHFKDNQEFAHASDDLLMRARYAIQQATTTPKIVIIQKTTVTTLRKIAWSFLRRNTIEKLQNSKKNHNVYL